MENFELQSCRSRRKLQFSYKVYLHPSSNKKITIFLKRDCTPTAVTHSGRKRYSTARLLPPWGTAVGTYHRPHGATCIVLQNVLRTLIFLQKKKNVKKEKIQALTKFFIKKLT
jgi:hypothetical protein